MIGPALLKNPFLVLLSTKNWPQYLNKLLMQNLGKLDNIDILRGNLTFSGSGLPKLNV